MVEGQHLTRKMTLLVKKCQAHKSYLSLRMYCVQQGMVDKCWGLVRAVVSQRVNENQKQVEKLVWAPRHVVCCPRLLWFLSDSWTPAIIHPETSRQLRTANKRWLDSINVHHHFKCPFLSSLMLCFFLPLVASFFFFHSFACLYPQVYIVF